MRRTCILLAALAVILPARAAAQTTTFSTYTRTYHGCWPGLSCHTATLTWFVDDNPGGIPMFYGFGTVQSWFGHNPWRAGWVSDLITSADPFPVYEGNMTSPNMGSTVAQPYFENQFWFGGYRVPTWVGLKIFYGVQPGEIAIMPPYAQVVPLSVTPEPATLVMVATGLGGVLLARRRRRNADTRVSSS